MFLGNILCLISDSTKTIRLLALDVYEVIVDGGFAPEILIPRNTALNWRMLSKKFHHTVAIT